MAITHLGSLGWVNPALYALQANFTQDVTVGLNNCGASSAQLVCCPHGFHATEGWDPVTGLGTLNFTRFKQVMTGLGNTQKELIDRNIKPTYAPTIPFNTSLDHTNFTTMSPTLNPTGKPTKSAGYAYVTYYSDDKCESLVERVEGYPSGVCNAVPATSLGGSSTNLTTVYVKYTCDEGI